jgi:penicillin-insensitive murein DD-endopeptidase
VSTRRGTLALVVCLAVSASTAPSVAQTVCEGRPGSGSLHDGALLAERPYLRIKRGSEAHVWGHPALLALVQRGARAAALAVPGSVALVGDLSSREGGPLSGHASHQAGLDADVALLVSDVHGRPVALEVFEAFGPDGRSLSNPDHVLDVYRNWLMLREWLSELRVLVSHVFIAPELRQLLLDYGKQSPEFVRYVPLAAKVLFPHATHADHFHVRIACPSDRVSGVLRDTGQP